MRYRIFNKINEKVSLLGMGAMRLPETADGEVDEKEAIDIIRSSVDSGVNYVDTAYNYHGGKSEVIVGKALKDGYRQKVLLADKMPIWMAKDEDKMKEIFDTQLERLDVDCIDMYLVHSVNVPNWKRAKKLNLLPFLEEMKAQGKIRYIGFSFHDSYELFEEVLGAYPWDFCQIQLNYIDTKYQAGIEGLKYAASKGMAVSIMEPLRGGYLANVPAAVKEIFDTTDKSAVEWGLDYLWNMPEVSVVLSGMSNEEQIAQNLEYASRSKAGMFSAEDEKVIEKVQAVFNSYDTVPCTGCSYCLPCPKGVGIPYNFVVYNNYKTGSSFEEEQKRYNEWVPMFGQKASACVACRKCEEICPQHINIVERLKKVAETFEV